MNNMEATHRDKQASDTPETDRYTGLRHDTNALIALSRKLERERNTLLNALHSVDHNMMGNEVYECAWINFPEIPERSPASYVREILSHNA